MGRIRFVFLMMSLTLAPMFARAAFTVCSYEAQPCDASGDHYLCRLVGWVGPGFPPTCAATNEATGPGRNSEIAADKMAVTDCRETGCADGETCKPVVNGYACYPANVTCSIVSDPQCVSQCMESGKGANVPPTDSCELCDIDCGGW